MGKVRSGLLIVLLLLCGCGDDDEAGGGFLATATTTVDITFDVRLVAAPSGFGCTYDHPGGNGVQVTVDDQDGRHLAVGEFQLTDDAEVCDWTVALEVPGDRSLYVISAGGTELATADVDDLADGNVRVDVNSAGTVHVD